MLFEYGPDPVLQQNISKVVRFFKAITVMVKSAPADFHHLAQNGDGTGLLFLPDEAVSQLDSFAKKAAAS